MRITTPQARLLGLVLSALCLLLLSAHYGFEPVASRLPVWLTRVWDNGKGGASVALLLSTFLGGGAVAAFCWMRESMKRDQSDGTRDIEDE